VNFNVFDSLLEPVFVLNADKSVKYCNDAAATICGLSLRKITKLKSFNEALNFDVPIVALENLSTLNDPSPYEEVRFTSTSQKEGRAQITIQRVIFENTDYWVVFFRDVTLEETLQKKYKAEWAQKEIFFQKLEIAHAELEKYSHGLEDKVKERTHELQYLNRLTQAMLDSLNQAFFLFDSKGHCLPIASRACETILETYPPNKNIEDVLQVKKEELENFKRWIHTIFSEMLPFEDLAPLGPSQFLHSQKKHIQLQYFPVRKDTQEIEAIVVVGTDTTDIDEAVSEAEREKAFARLVINIIKKKKAITQFISDTKHFIAELKLAINKPEAMDVDHIFRILHTIKGSSATYSILTLTQACHTAESLITEARFEGFPPELKNHLKNQAAKIDEAFNEFLDSNEEILGKSAISGVRTIELPIEEIQQIFGRLKKISQAAQLACELEDKILSVPIKSLFDVYHEVIQQVAHNCGKKVNPLIISGGEILARTEIYSDLFTTFVHQFNNSVDHGIESPEERISKGKTAEGNINVSITLEASGNIENSYLKICISDDGKGIDPQIIRKKLAEREIDTSLKTDSEVIQYVFNSQFSTRTEVTETSGRGVGLDAVLYAARKLKGNAWIESAIDRGTSLHVCVPYFSVGGIKAA
jgi:two-component system chemotaxis sensor kinase CheA